MDRITQAQLDAAELKPDPLPDAWILAGAPRSRAAELRRSADGAEACFLWDCTAGEYLWRYSAHETIEILEGEAVVDDGSGPRTLGVGAQARFRAGAIARWRIPTYVKKISYCRDPQPQAWRLARRAARKLRSLGRRRVEGPDAELASRA